jgi:hypothetical protein
VAGQAVSCTLDTLAFLAVLILRSVTLGFFLQEPLDFGASDHRAPSNLRAL